MVNATLPPPRPGRLSSVMHWLFTLLFCLAVAGALAFFKFSEIQAAVEGAAAQPEYSETVETVVPVVATYSPVIETLGVAVAPLQIVLRNELAGYITQVKAAAGSQVRKGQVIIQLDISEQQANLDSARARAALAESVLKRDLDLQKSSYVSQDRVERSRAELDVVKAEIAAIESVINRRTLRAPFDGVIGIHRFEPGQFLDSNTEITTLVGDNGQMWVDFSVPQFYGELATGSTVKVKIVRAEGMAQSVPMNATVIAGDATISAAARSRRYRAVVAEGADQLLDNMSVTVEVPVGADTTLMAVPSIALQSDIAGQFVWVLDRDPQGYRARRQGVITYGQAGDQTYVDTLTTNDLIAAAGAFKLSRGLLVKTTAGSAPRNERGVN